MPDGSTLSTTRPSGPSCQAWMIRVPVQMAVWSGTSLFTPMRSRSPTFGRRWNIHANR